MRRSDFMTQRRPAGGRPTAMPPAKIDTMRLSRIALPEQLK
jgi:hypothetical protein